MVELFGFIRWDAEGYPPVERYSFNMDIEAFAVGMFPGTSDAGPEGFAFRTVADMVSNMGWKFGSRRLGVGGIVVHGKSPFRFTGLAPFAA